MFGNCNFWKEGIWKAWFLGSLVTLAGADSLYKLRAEGLSSEPHGPLYQADRKHRMKRALCHVAQRLPRRGANQVRNGSRVDQAQHLTVPLFLRSSLPRFFPFPLRVLPGHSWLVFPPWVAWPLG
jgi:hypothetical protein